MAQSSLHAKGPESSSWHFQGPLNLRGNIFFKYDDAAYECTSISVCGSEPACGETVMLYATWERLLASHPFLQMNVSQRYPG